MQITDDNFSAQMFSQKLNVENLCKPVRLDVYCAEHIKRITRSQLKVGLKSLLVNSHKTKLSRMVNNGDIIELIWENPIPLYAVPENIPLTIIYEDKNIIAVNKKQGIVTHPAGGNWNGTLVNGLNYYRLFNSKYTDDFAKLLNNLEQNNFDGKAKINLHRMGIVHRLDKETSGVIITARNIQTDFFLKSEFKKRKVKKYYLAILDGCPKKLSGKIKTSVFRSSGDRKKFKASEDLSCGKTALSSYKILKTNGRYSFAVFRIFTGRTHQIRVHSKFIGCPVLGDRVYGKKTSVKNENRLLLHSYKLIINIPEAGKKEFKARLPQYFRQALLRLGLC